MKWFVKVINWIKKEVWWRPYYKRVSLDEKEIWKGRCLSCHAGIPKNKSSIRCGKKEGRYCPCNYNQCLKLK